MSVSTPIQPKSPTSNEWLLIVAVSCCVAGFVWRDLLFGGGLVGGDTYPYFFPQKQMMVEAFQREDLPMWHDRTSLGYPLHAESQAGVLYPTNQLLYRFFDLNDGYNASIILHYIAAFVLTWRFAMSQRLSSPASVFAATAFVYGWFPARLSLEWSIIGGVWFPACLWATQRLLDRPSARRWLVLCVCFAVHLLAGHFTLAFITQLTCVGFAILAAPKSDSSGTRWRMMILILLAIGFSILLASVQLIPTLELRQLSQRDGSNPAFNPGYGHMPPIYVTQLVASWWFWHSPEVVAAREMTQYPFLMSSADTNQVEAHLYVGLMPMLLLAGLMSSRVRHLLRMTQWKVWMVLSLVAVVYSFGWLVPVFRHLPGFGFFMGPGRYTMITALGLALVAGLVFDVWTRKRSAAIRVVIAVVASLVTLSDVLKSSEPPVCDAQIVATPPLDGLSESWVARLLQAEDKTGPVRLLAAGPNIGNLFGVSSVPQYLGLGPAEYFSEEFKVQTGPESASDLFPSDELRSKLHRYAVTHILTTEKLANPAADLELLQAAPDGFLNRVWGRGSDSCFLYKLTSARSRVSANPPSALASIKFQLRTPEDIKFRVVLNETAVVEVCDLMFQGWLLTVDGVETMPETSKGFGRFVKVPAGDHVIHWSYRPSSFRLGLGMSSFGVVIAACVLWAAKRKRVSS